MITLYVLRGKTIAKRYIGITNDLHRRVGEHRSGCTKGGQILGEFEVIHIESFADHRAARVREKFLKSGKGREWLNIRYLLSRPA
jgi:putative endonuclease